ncbi:MAG TPA: cyclic nucleotide-binding domain-containing protein [Spirochaetales bacterium]|nr:cyclic nucleotide-binding domain-containing protein [Spirochaetales bacterium]
MIEVSALQKYALFGGLSADDITAIKPYMGGAAYDPGDAIISEGKPNGRIHFIIDGRVQVTKRNRSLVELGEGEAFGEVEVLDVQPAVATIRAITVARIVYISNANLHAIYKADSRIFSMLIMNLARELARRLRRADELLCPEDKPQ